MTWTDVNFDEVVAGDEILPEDQYTFEVISATRDRFDREKFSIRLDVAAGPYKGQRLYVEYPNPGKADKNHPEGGPQNWVIKAFKLFLNAVKPFGYTLHTFETPVDFVNRIVAEADAKNEPILIMARNTHNTYTDKETNELVTKNKVTPRSVRPYEPND